MNKRMNFMFTIAAIAVMGGALFGSSFTSQMTGTALTTDENVLKKIQDMGGLELVMPAAFAYSGANCDDAAFADRTVVEFNLTGVSIDLPRLGGGTFSAMTFSEQIPGPTLRVTQGDVVKMTLTVPEGEATPHGNDMHASQIDSTNFGSNSPGTSKTYCYIAEVPGVFKYHCSGVGIAAMDQHVLQGMYGIAIVDPIDGYSKVMVEKTAVNANGDTIRDRQFYSGDALEFQIQYNQMYLTAEGTYDATAMFAHQTPYTAVNGHPFGYVPNDIHNLLNGHPGTNIFVAQPWNSMDLHQYQSQLLFTPTGTHNRIFVENHGNEPVYFHIVGEILDRVTQGSRVQSAGTETWLLGGSQNMIVDLVYDEPGIYALVNHDYAAIYTGAATIFVAGLPLPTINATATALGVVQGAVDTGMYAGVLGNPYDAIPPYGEQSIMHPAKNVHCMCSDGVAAAQAAEGAVELWVAVPAILAAAAEAAE